MLRNRLARLPTVCGRLCGVNHSRATVRAWPPRRRHRGAGMGPRGPGTPGASYATTTAGGLPTGQIASLSITPDQERLPVQAAAPGHRTGRDGAADTGPGTPSGLASPQPDAEVVPGPGAEPHLTGEACAQRFLAAEQSLLLVRLAADCGARRGEPAGAAAGPGRPVLAIEANPIRWHPRPRQGWAGHGG